MTRCHAIYRTKGATSTEYAIEEETVTVCALCLILLKKFCSFNATNYDLTMIKTMIAGPNCNIPGSQNGEECNTMFLFL